ncbi:NAD(P)-dependent oxidoreductase [Arthrobacter sp. MI7-26]|uniref:NAD(P)-dependent oxidoreductase n=1 Tax=Arthrobacter sp. MI7-26 TaxID=2993653 RepID=UPI002248D5A8|nr:NAD(P)-dependent oxidoreductase [Arthrobacter sp. MI7-26]MCX2750445.1 NAD(P)-dependent oxidoreductase [Arthrobacter sp. MI7-26]
MQDNTKPTVGWIGMGRMGFPLASRLIDAGYSVAVYNRTKAKAKAKAEPLKALGASLVDAPELLANRDIVFSMVSTSDDLCEATMGKRGLFVNSDRAPRMLVGASTISQEASAEIRQSAQRHGTQYPAAPVSGNPETVRAGRLTVAVSGPWEAYTYASPLLESWGRSVTYVGEGERARVVKIALNAYLAVSANALLESIVLAEKAGVRRADFLSFLNNSVIGSDFSRYKTHALLSLDFTPTFTSDLLLKDLDLALSSAEDLQIEMSNVSLVRDFVAMEVRNGNIHEDFAAMILTLAKAAHLELQPEF